MANSPTFNKREKEKNKQAKLLAKKKRKEERKFLGKSKSFEDMIAYVDENGVIVSSLPEKVYNQKIIIKKEQSIQKEDGIIIQSDI